MATEVVERIIRIRGQTTDVDKAAADVARLSGSLEGVSIASEDAGKKVSNLEYRLKASQRQFDESYRASERFAKVQDLWQRAVESGARTQEQANHHLELARKRIFDIEDQTKKGTRSTAQLQDQMRQLSFQANDAATMLASGSGPFQIIATQSGQVVQALDGPGGVRQGLRNVTSALVSAITPARALGAALVAAAGVAVVAWNRFDDAQKAAQVTLQGLGRRLGLTVGQFEELNRAAAQAGDLSVAQAREIGNAFARTGAALDPSTLQRFVALSKDFAATYTDGDLTAGMEMQRDLLKGGADAIAEMGLKQGLFDRNQQRAIEQAVRMGDENKALLVLMDALNGRLVKSEEVTGNLRKAWDDIKKSFSDMVTTFGPFIDKMATAAAALMGAAARGAASIFGQGATGSLEGNPIADRVRQGTGIGANIGAAFAGAEPDYGLAINQTKELTSAQRELNKVQNETYDAHIKTAQASDKASMSLDDQRAALIRARDELRARNVDETNLQEKQGGWERLRLMTEAIEKATPEALKLGQAFERMSNAEALAEKNKLDIKFNKQTEAARAAAKETDDYGQKLDVLNARIEKLQALPADKRTSDETAALEKDLRARETLQRTEEKAEAQRRIEIDSLKAVGPLQEAGIARIRKRNELAGESVSKIEAEKAEQHAYNMVLLEHNEQMKRQQEAMSRVGKLIELETSLIGKSAAERQVAIAAQQTENELTERGIDTKTRQAQAYIAAAKANAQLRAEQQKAQFTADVNFERTTATMPSQNREIAQRLRGMMGDNANDNVQSVAADQIRSAKNIAFAWQAAEQAVGDFASSFVRDMQNGVKVADALANAAKNVGQSLTQGGLQFGLQSLMSGNMVGAGIGAGVAGIGALLSAFGPNDRAKQRRQQIIEASMKAQEDQQKAAEKQAEAIRDAAQRVADAQKEAAEIAEEAARVAEAAARRAESYRDRAFRAGLDTNTLQGRIAALALDQWREFEEEMRQGGQAANELVSAHLAEEQRIRRDFAQREADERKRLLEEQQKFFEQTARNIRSFLDQLRGGAGSPLSPEGRFQAAQEAFNRQLRMAQAGDREAMQGITGYAQTLLDAARDYFASSSGFQAVFQRVVAVLETLMGGSTLAAAGATGSSRTTGGTTTSTGAAKAGTPVVAAVSAGGFDAVISELRAVRDTVYHGHRETQVVVTAAGRNVREGVDNLKGTVETTSAQQVLEQRMSSERIIVHKAA